MDKSFVSGECVSSKLKRHGAGKLLRPALALAFLIGAALCTNAWAGAGRSGAPPLPVCALDPHDSTRLALQPCRPAPPKQPLARRSVPQVIETMPRAAPPPVYGYRPAAPPPNPAPVAPGAPLPVTGCDSGACRDAAGVRYNGGVGNATLDPNGRVCNRNGPWLQCF